MFVHKRLSIIVLAAVLLAGCAGPSGRLGEEEGASAVSQSDGREQDSSNTEPQSLSQESEIDWYTYEWKDYEEFDAFRPYIELRMPAEECYAGMGYTGAITFLAPSDWGIGEGGYGVLHRENGTSQGTKMGEIQFIDKMIDGFMDIRHEGYSRPEALYPDSRENTPGARCQTDKFERTVGGMGNMNLLDYLVDLDGEVCISLYFYVSAEATADDLAKFDEIVNTFTRVEE